MLVVPNAAGTALALSLLAGCAASQQPQQAPALLVQPSAQTRKELALAVAAEFGGVQIPLADDALTHSSELTLERSALRDPGGLRVNGRELGRPELFHLVLVDGRCVLIHDRTGHRATLSTARCKAVSP